MAIARLSPPIVTLTTDFGLADHYVGTMKGVILSYCAAARIIDISHEIPPFSIYAGAYTIDQAAPYFPPGTVHVVVVDPGVGTSRKPILVEASEQYFIAPDNGVLSLILESDKEPKVHEIRNRYLWLHSPSSTFHGRDIFAPVAAAIACGMAAPQDVGPKLEYLELLPDLAPQQLSSHVWRGRVQTIDRFGNIVTNFKAKDFPALPSTRFSMEANGHEVREFHDTFGTAATGVSFAYFGSSGCIELGQNQRSAAAQMRVVPGDLITLHLHHS